MAFLKFSRDKQGYEHFELVQPTNRRGKVRPRLLYSFRSPPNVKVGREPFDPETRRALETQNPDVNFDWPGIVETPIPPADTEWWRERRRAERATKQAAETQIEAVAETQQEGAAIEERNPVHGEAERLVVVADEPVATSESNQTAVAVPAPDATLPVPDVSGQVPARHRRRRRRGRRGQNRPQVPGSGTQVQGSENQGSSGPSSHVQNSGESENENPER